MRTPRAMRTYTQIFAEHCPAMGLPGAAKDCAPSNPVLIGRPVDYAIRLTRVKSLFMTQMAGMQELPIEGERAQLVSRDAHNAVHAAFDALTRTILVDNARTRTLEHLVGEMMRPMLKSWLDNNLPPLVERLVRAEIERVSPPRRTANPTSQ